MLFPIETARCTARGWRWPISPAAPVRPVTSTPVRRFARASSTMTGPSAPRPTWFATPSKPTPISRCCVCWPKPARASTLFREASCFASSARAATRARRFFPGSENALTRSSTRLSKACIRSTANRRTRCASSIRWRPGCASGRAWPIASIPTSMPRRTSTSPPVYAKTSLA